MLKKLLVKRLHFPTWGCWQVKEDSHYTLNRCLYSSERYMSTSNQLFRVLLIYREVKWAVRGVNFVVKFKDLGCEFEMDKKMLFIGIS